MTVDFNPRAPCGARRPSGDICRRSSIDFNPRAPCGARLLEVGMDYQQVKFQPTRPLRGATDYKRLSCGRTGNFNPRAPCGARRRATASHTSSPNFNPRAPCGARRCVPHPFRHTRCNFNPRAPCGARPRTLARAGANASFQPTRPLRGATRRVYMAEVVEAISTHAPLAGRDDSSSQQA